MSELTPKESITSGLIGQMLTLYERMMSNGMDKDVAKRWAPTVREAAKLVEEKLLDIKNLSDESCVFRELWLGAELQIKQLKAENEALKAREAVLVDALKTCRLTLNEIPDTRVYERLRLEAIHKFDKVMATTPTQAAEQFRLLEKVAEAAKTILDDCIKEFGEEECSCCIQNELCLALSQLGGGTDEL